MEPAAAARSRPRRRRGVARYPPACAALDVDPPWPVATPTALTLAIEPVANCARSRIAGPATRGAAAARRRPAIGTARLPRGNALPASRRSSRRSRRQAVTRHRSSLPPFRAHSSRCCNTTGCTPSTACDRLPQLPDPSAGRTPGAKGARLASVARPGAPRQPPISGSAGYARGGVDDNPGKEGDDPDAPSAAP
jgi:hypothetical protein